MYMYYVDYIMSIDAHIQLSTYIDLVVILYKVCFIKGLFALIIYEHLWIIKCI